MGLRWQQGKSFWGEPQDSQELGTRRHKSLQFKALSGLKPVLLEERGDLQANSKVNVSKGLSLLSVGCRREEDLRFDVLTFLVRPESVPLHLLE